MYRYKEITALRPCRMCFLQLSESQTSEYMAVFHPELSRLILKIHKKLNNFPKGSSFKHTFPTKDCSNLCAAKVLANYLIVDIVKNEPSSLVLVKQLADKLSSLPDLNFVSNKQKQCHLCGVNFLSASKTISHFMLRHPEYLALVRFLQFRPLSELNFYVPEIADNKTTSEKLLQRISGTRVLGVRQPIIQIEKLPDHLYQECIAKGFVNLKKKNGTRSPFDPQPNPRLNKISIIVMQKRKETTTKTSQSNEKNPEVLAPKNILNSHQEISDSEVSSHTNEKNPVVAPGNMLDSDQEKSDSEGCFPSCSLNNTNDATNSQTTSKVISYGAEHLKKDRLRRQPEKEKIVNKQLLLKKLLDKHHEKEARKEVVYWQRGLTVYVKRNQKYLRELGEQLLLARKLLRNTGCYDKLLTQVNCNLESGKVRKTVKFYLKKIFKAIENVQTLLSKGDGSEGIEQPLIQNHQTFPTPKDRCDKKSNLNTAADLLVNTSLVTVDKQLVECNYCRKLNCEGLHPENFIH